MGPQLYMQFSIPPWTVLISGLHFQCVYILCNPESTIRTTNTGQILLIQEESSCFHCRLLCSLSAKVKKKGLDVIKSECYIEPPSQEPMMSWCVAMYRMCCVCKEEDKLFLCHLDHPRCSQCRGHLSRGGLCLGRNPHHHILAIGEVFVYTHTYT